MRTAPIVAAFIFAFFGVTPGEAITIYQVDDFQDLTTQNWTSGAPNPNPPINVSDVGPLGIGDHALQVTANGMSGPGGNLVTFNTDQWLGNYLANGVTAIRFDVNNIGANPVSLGFDINFGSVITYDTGTISPGSGWNTYEIPLNAFTTGSSAALSNVTNFRLRYIQGGSFVGGSAIQILVDNIRAIPEPSSLLLAGCLTGMLGVCRPRRRRA